MKRKLYMVPVLLMLGIFLTICPAYADDTIRVYVDKTEIQFDVAPQLYENRTMVPVRSIFEALGAQVIWNGEAQTVTAVKGDTITTVVIGEPSFYVNGSRKAVAVAPFLQNDRTFVPLRAVVESFGYQVEWNQEERLAMITTKQERAKVKAVNHRGYSIEAPENTLSAYVLSKEKGFRYVETDVQTTKDGVPVLLHNATIDATSNGKGILSEMTYHEVSGYDFGSWKAEKYAGEKIPTFDEFMALCKELELHPYIEIAKLPTWADDAQKLFDIVGRYDMQNDVTWISFNADALSDIRRIDPSSRLGLLCMEISEANIDRVQALKTESNEVFLNVYYSSLSPEQILACKALAIPVEVWTVNSEEVMRSLDPYISGVTSDYLNVNNYLTE
ncbi:MAG: hypothetical protein E7400_06185 [Ruminococcaceae bacterium]|nr:hypothetical protein [Oscillospiraceae bacterium]